MPGQPPVPVSPAKLSCKKMNNFASKNKLINIAIFLMIAIFFIADRYLKLLALNSTPLQPVNLIGDFFSYSFSANYYMAFSLPLGGWLLNIIILIIIALLIYYIFYLILNKKFQKIHITLLTIILLGAISNMLDRLLYGYVIDYLDLKYFTIFNLADTAILLTTCYLIIISLTKNKTMIAAENLNFVIDSLARATTELNGHHKRVAPTKENAVDLLILHDLKELIQPAKKEGSYDQDLLKKILVEDYRKKFQAGKCSTFYNFRKILSNPEYFGHFQAMLSEQAFNKN